MAEAPKGPSSFEVSHQMQDSSGSSVRSGGNIASATGGSGTAASIGKGVGETMKNINISNNLATPGFSSILHIESISEKNIFEIDRLDSLAKINAFENMGQLNAIGNVNIGEATSVTKNFEMELEGKTGPASRGGGQGH